MSKLTIGGNIGGIIFALGCVLIFLIGVPAIRYMFPVAAVLGLGIALVLHFIKPKAPGKDWIGPAVRKSAGGK